MFALMPKVIFCNDYLKSCMNVELPFLFDVKTESPACNFIGPIKTVALSVLYH